MKKNTSTCYLTRDEVAELAVILVGASVMAPLKKIAPKLIEYFFSVDDGRPFKHGIRIMARRCLITGKRDDVFGVSKITEQTNKINEYRKQFSVNGHTP